MWSRNWLVFKTGFVLCARGVHMPCWDSVGVNSNCTMGLFWDAIASLISKSGWTPYVYYRTPRREPFLRAYWADFLKKWGNQSKRQLCKEKSWITLLKTVRVQVLRTTIFFLLLFDTLSHKTPICILSEDDNLILGIHSSHDPSFMAIPRLRGKLGQISSPKQSHRAIQHNARSLTRNNRNRVLTFIALVTSTVSIDSLNCQWVLRLALVINLIWFHRMNFNLKQFFIITVSSLKVKYIFVFIFLL